MTTPSSFEVAPRPLWTLSGPHRYSYAGNGFLGQVWLEGEPSPDPFDSRAEVWRANVSYPIPGTPQRGFIKLQSGREGDGSFFNSREAMVAVEQWKRVDAGTHPPPQRLETFEEQRMRLAHDALRTLDILGR